MASHLFCGVLLGVAMLGAPALAQPQAGPTTARTASAVHGDLPWAALTSEQQDALAPLKREWPAIDTQRRRKWVELANRFSSLPAEEQRRVQARMTEWAQMSPDDRARARLHFQEMRNLSPQERKARWEAYLALPPEQRRALANPRTVRPARQADPTPGQKSARASGPVERGTQTPPGTGPRAIAPAVVQPTPGATTTLMSNAPSTAAPPRADHAKALGATSGRVNHSTLLPRAPAQAASAAPVPR